MLSSVTELIERVAQRLAAQSVDIGLDEIRAGAGDAESLDAERLRELRSKLVERRAALETAREDLTRLAAAVEDLEPIIPLTEQGWPRRRAELEAAMANDPARGLAMWLEDWFRAAADLRTDALDRLSGIQLPRGAELVGVRARRAADGLRAKSWDLAEPFLAAGAYGLEVDGHTLSSPVRDEVVRAGARLAVADALLPEAEEWLAKVKSAWPPAIADTLEARLAQRLYQEETAAEHARAAFNQSPTDLEVAVEAIRHVRGVGTLTTALDTARGAVDALPSLLEIDVALDRLMTEIPAEVWIAVAERALREGDDRLIDHALDAADRATDEDSYPVQAFIAERRVAAAQTRDTDARVHALAEAGSLRLFAGEPRLAREHLEDALELAPENDDVTMRLADCLVVLGSNEPLVERREIMLEAIRLLDDVRRRRAFEDGYAWGFAVEAEAQRTLAETSAANEHDHLWRAMLAGARSVAHEPELAPRWTLLMQCATDLNLHHTGLALADRAAELGADEASEDARRQSLANVGRYEEALAILPVDGDSWQEAVRGYSLAMCGRHAEALEVLERTEIEPRWNWARLVLIFLRIIAGDTRRASAEAESILDQLGEGFEEIADRHALFTALVVLGRLDEAVHYASTPDAREKPDVSGGTALILAGRTEQGITALCGAIARSPQRDLIYWNMLQRPAVDRLVGDLGLEPPDLSAVDAAIAERARELEKTSGPVSELEEADTHDADPAVTRTARAGVVAILDLARGDLDAVLEHFAEGSAAASDPDLRRLADHAAQRQREERRAEAQDRDVREALAGDADAQRRLLDHETWAVASAVVAAGGQTGGQTIAERLEGDADQRAAMLASALRTLTTTAPEPPTIGLELPPSWFTGHDDDPVSTHPLFRRHLPALRASAVADIPPVNVRAEWEREPDGYRILWDERVVAEGRADPERRWVKGDALAWLPPHLRALADADQSLPADAVKDAGRFAELITLSHLELIMDAIEDAALAHFDLGPADPSPQR